MSWIATAIIGGAVIGGATSLIGAGQQSSAMEGAAQTQSDAAKYAADLQYKMWQQQQAQMYPWLNVGSGAVNQLAYLMGINPQTQYNPAVSPVSPGGGRTGVASSPTSTVDRSGMARPTGVNALPAELGLNPNYVYYDANGVLQDRISGEPAVLPRGYQQYQNLNTLPSSQQPIDMTFDPATGSYAPSDQRARTMPVPIPGITQAEVRPSRDTLQDSQYQGTFGSLMDTGFSPEEFLANQDPGYEWRKQQGVNALMASGAASGMYGSGNLGTALVDYGQNQASAEYQNAYNRYMESQNTLYNRLAGLSGTGQVQSQALGNLGMTAASNIGNFGVQGANALAAGQVGAAQASAGGLTGVSNALTGGLGTYLNYQNQQQLLNLLQQRNQLPYGQTYNNYGNDVWY